jgi:hypothetical protein
VLKIQIPWDVMPCRLDIPTGQQHWKGLTGTSRQYESGEEGETRANHPVVLDTRVKSRYTKCWEMCENQDRVMLHGSFIFITCYNKVAHIQMLHLPVFTDKLLVS